jgi:hypothetical protein
MNNVKYELEYVLLLNTLTDACELHQEKLNHILNINSSKSAVNSLIADSDEENVCTCLQQGTTNFD